MENRLRGTSTYIRVNPSHIENLKLTKQIYDILNLGRLFKRHKPNAQRKMIVKQRNLSNRSQYTGYLKSNSNFPHRKYVQYEIVKNKVLTSVKCPKKEKEPRRRLPSLKQISPIKTKLFSKDSFNDVLKTQPTPSTHIKVHIRKKSIGIDPWNCESPLEHNLSY